MAKKLPSKSLLLTLCLLLAPVFSGHATEESKTETEKSPSPATVLIFMITDCPIANRYVPEINRIFETYTSKNIKFTLVYTNKSLTTEDISTHRKEYALKPKGVLDPRHELVKKAGATLTPEAVVFNAAGEIVYRGRIDDRFTAYGDQRRQASEQNLRLALDAVLAGNEVKVKRAEAIGCLIEE